MEGWIKIHRKILENPIICKDSDYLAVWIYLLLNATHKEIPALFRGKKITLQKGQLITGRKSMSNQLKISESKIYRIINDFKSEQQIEQQTSNQNSLISILNWDKYQQIEQQNEQQMNNERTTDEQPVNTNKNVKNDKNVKNERNNIPASEETSPADTAKANRKHKYGEYQNVLLKDEELQTLKREYENWEELIKHLDEYIEMKGYKAKSHYLCIRKWVVDAVKREKAKEQVQQNNTKERKVDNSNCDRWLEKKMREEAEKNAIQRI